MANHSKYREDRPLRQIKAANWAEEAFGVEETRCLPQRGLRLVEEAIEAAQAVGCDKETLHKLVDYVYSRPVGNLRQELGGVGVTTLLLANAAGLSADAAEADEVERVLSKPRSTFTARNNQKNAAGFKAT